MTFKNIREKGNYRTEDADRQIVLRKIDGPDPEGFYTFKLEIAGEFVNFSGVSRMKFNKDRIFGVTKGMYDLDWYFNRLCIPSSHNNRKNEIAGIITEAMKIWGHSYDEEIANSVSVTFSPELLA